MPYRPHPQASPRDQLAFEVRLCFFAAAGCLAVGGIGWLVNRLAHIETHLPALVAVGAFYGVMGLARWWKLSRTTDAELQNEPSSPGH